MSRIGNQHLSHFTAIFVAQMIDGVFVYLNPTRYLSSIAVSLLVLVQQRDELVP